MRKLALFLALVLLMMVPVSAEPAPASEDPAPRAVTIDASLTFSGTTAYCSCDVAEDSPSAYIVVTMKLRKGNTVLKEWSKAGTGSVSMDKTATVTKGQTYILTVDVMVNGTSKPQQSVTKTC